MDARGELIDPHLSVACAAALEEHANATRGVRVCTANSLCRYWADEDMGAAENTEPVVLRGFLSAQQCDAILQAATAKGVFEPADDEIACDALRDVAHHVPLSSEHIVLYMHREGWFPSTLPAIWSHVLGGMRSQQPWVEPDAPLNVRCIELHHYSTGGCLLTPSHRDNGSSLTMSVLLSETAASTGGTFVTYDEGMPIAHEMARGDAILFNSEKLHNVTTVTSGTRQSLVVELWPAPTNASNRFA